MTWLQAKFIVKVPPPAVTVSVEVPDFPPKVPVMVAVPAATAVASPLLLIVAADVGNALQVTCRVMF